MKKETLELLATEIEQKLKKAAFAQSEYEGLWEIHQRVTSEDDQAIAVVAEYRCVPYGPSNLRELRYCGIHALDKEGREINVVMPKVSSARGPREEQMAKWFPNRVYEGGYGRSGDTFEFSDFPSWITGFRRTKADEYELMASAGKPSLENPPRMYVVNFNDPESFADINKSLLPRYKFKK